MTTHTHSPDPKDDRPDPSGAGTRLRRGLVDENTTVPTTPGQADMTGAELDPAITAEQLAYLERRYTHADDQKCDLCGAPLTYSSNENGRARYNCSSDDASPVRSTRPLAERIAHYANSAWFDSRQADAIVLLLVRAYRELTEGTPP